VIARALVVAALVASACTSAPPPATPPSPRAPIEPARRDITVPTPPVTLVIARGTLVWTDIAGAIYTMPVDGSRPPRELSNQHAPSFAFRVVRVGDRVYASTKRDLFEVALPDGPVTPLGLHLAETPEQIVADSEHVYVTLFQRDDVLRIDPSQRAVEKWAEAKKGVLAVADGVLYIASYTRGTLVEIRRDRRVVPRASNLPHPTALAIGDGRAFVYTELDRMIGRIEGGEPVELARDLGNGDRLVYDARWLYTYTATQVLRVPADGSRPPQVLADDLVAPRAIVVERDAIWIASRDQRKLVRIARRAGL